MQFIFRMSLNYRFRAALTTTTPQARAEAAPGLYTKVFAYCKKACRETARGKTGVQATGLRRWGGKDRGPKRQVFVAGVEKERALAQAEIGIIGGSGLYSMPGFTNVHEETVETPFGEPSEAFVLGELEGRKVAFLARHGRGHRILPSELNFRANIYAMKKLGVERILSVSAVGSLKEEHKPTDFVIPDQFIDRTFHRVSTFFGEGIVGHVAFGDPVCATVAKAAADACATVGVVASWAGLMYVWKARSFPPGRSRISIAVGTPT